MRKVIFQSDVFEWFNRFPIFAQIVTQSFSVFWVWHFSLRLTLCVYTLTDKSVLISLTSYLAPCRSASTTKTLGAICKYKLSHLRLLFRRNSEPPRRSGLNLPIVKIRAKNF